MSRFLNGVWQNDSATEEVKLRVILRLHIISHSFLSLSHLDKQHHSNDLLLLLLLLLCWASSFTPTPPQGRKTGVMMAARGLLLLLLYLSLSTLRSAAVSQVTQPENDIIPVSTHTCFLKKSHP